MAKPKQKPGRRASGAEKPLSVSQVQKQLRGIQRLLNRPDLPPDARAKQEAAIAKLNESLGGAKRRRLESHRSTKYHKVKFFERQKCDRRIKQATKKLLAATDEGERRALEEQLEALRADMQYIRYYPPEHKYISLYSLSVEGDAAFIEKRRLKMRALVAKRIAEGKGRTDQDGDDDDDEDGDAGGKEAEAPDDFFLNQ